MIEIVLFSNKSVLLRCVRKHLTQSLLLTE